MLISITMKDPDGFWDSLREAGIDPNNLDELNDGLTADHLSRFIKWYEYVTIEIDTTTGTARVVPVEGVSCLW